MVGLVFFMNGYRKNPQMEYYPCPKYGMVYSPDLYIQFTGSNKKSKKWPRVKVHILKHDTTK